jgi:hypothetical protein
MRAARIIVRNARFFFGLKRWRRWKKDRILKVVKKYVERVVERGVRARVGAVVALHRYVSQ